MAEASMSRHWRRARGKRECVERAQYELCRRYQCTSARTTTKSAAQAHVAPFLSQGGCINQPVRWLVLVARLGKMTCKLWKRRPSHLCMALGACDPTIQKQTASVLAAPQLAPRLDWYPSPPQLAPRLDGCPSPPQLPTAGDVQGPLLCGYGSPP